MTASLPLAAVELYLRARGLDQQYPGTKVFRGQGTDPTLLRAVKDRGIILTAAPGPGLTLEWLFDQPVVNVHTMGRQQSYDDGEAFAADVDRMMLASSVTLLGTVRALYVRRMGGPPTHILTDASRRVHFTCSYVIPVASGL